jgi:transposase
VTVHEFDQTGRDWLAFQVSGLEEMYREELIALTRALLAENVALRAELAELRAENARIRAENAELRERVAKLERRVSRNSGNSGMPPSLDDAPGKKQPKDRATRSDGGSGRPPGQTAGGAWNGAGLVRRRA